MHKGDLVKAIAAKTSFLQKDAELLINAFISTVKEVLKNGDKITLVGFGTFSVIDTKEKMGRNPQTGKAIKIPASKRVKFKPGKALKTEVKPTATAAKSTTTAKKSCKKK